MSSLPLGHGRESFLLRELLASVQREDIERRGERSRMLRVKCSAVTMIEVKGDVVGKTAKRISNGDTRGRESFRLKLTG